MNPERDSVGECGASLGTRPATTGKSDRTQIRRAESSGPQRKTVTALFADIKGSTDLEQDLDPEEARATTCRCAAASHP